MDLRQSQLFDRWLVALILLVCGYLMLMLFGSVTLP